MSKKFAELRKLNVNEYVEKKNGLSYLSWAWALDQLLLSDPEATWRYEQPAMFGDTMMVFCTVTANGVSRTMQLPVMDYKNKAIHSPDAFAVNTAMQRCLVKAIALHGIGLYIYAGEDLPDGEEAGIDPKAHGIGKLDRKNLPPPDASSVRDDFADKVDAILKGLASGDDIKVYENYVAMNGAEKMKAKNDRLIDNKQFDAIRTILNSVRSANGEEK